MFLLASVTSLMIQNGLGTCLSFGFGSQATERFAVTVPCNSTDPNQINWIVTNVNTSINNSSGQGVMFCNKKTYQCVGKQKNRLGMYNINLQMMTKDPSDPAQQWLIVDTPYMAGHFVNGQSGRCAQAYSSFNQGGFINSVQCRNLLAQQWSLH